MSERALTVCLVLTLKTTAGIKPKPLLTHEVKLRVDVVK